LDYPFLALHSAHSLSADIFHFHIMVYAFILFHMYHPPILSFSFSFLFYFLSFLILIIFLEIFIHGRLNKVERSLAPPWYPSRGECATRCTGSFSCLGTSGAP
jgi:hypothetical protein